MAAPSQKALEFIDRLGETPRVGLIPWESHLDAFTADLREALLATIVDLESMSEYGFDSAFGARDVLASYTPEEEKG